MHPNHTHHPGSRRFAHPEHDHTPHTRHGRGGRMARFLEHGDLRLLVLHLIAEKPRHGYESIKAIEDLAGGAYTPSPGVIYPTLTLLEDLAQVESTAEGTRKLFNITPTGTSALAEAQPAIDTLLARLAIMPPPATPILRATENLKTALRLKLSGPARTIETIRKIADLLDAVTRQIEDL